jgi:MerR family redox-sensitive transcriptional activator SoxR
MALAQTITIGELAQRTGVATSALRFYEAQGLIRSLRTEGNQRRFERAMVRRVSVIRAAQRCGLSLDEIAAALGQLPSDRPALKKDWARMSRTWQMQLDQRIAALELLRQDLASCIGCGCLSLQRCNLLNKGDVAARLGSGPRYLLGDTSDNASELAVDETRALAKLG